MASLYTPLDAEAREIRVLVVRSQTSDDGLIACSLTVVSLDEQPDFTTLSYCWGAPQPTKEILINGTRNPVTPNLAAALDHFRDSKDAEATPIWIDALCINQNDLDERSAQVAMMMSIYAQSRCVHIWLGDEMGPLSNAMLTLEEVFTVSDKSDSVIEARCQALVDTWCAQSWNYVAAKLRHILQIGANPYWQRMWILQEASFARIIIMHAKGGRVDLGPSGELKEDARHVAILHLNKVLSELSIAVMARVRSDRRLTISTEIVDDIFDLTDRVENMLAVMVRVNWNKRIGDMIWSPSDIGVGAIESSNPELFITYRRMLSTNPKDKIYGLLGFVKELRGLAPDYKKSTRLIYCEATLRLMRAAKDLRYLHQACPVTDRLPSWVPDYSTPCAWLTWRAARASQSSSSRDFNSTFCMDVDGALDVKGLIFDEVKSVSGHVHFNDKDLSSVQEAWDGWLSRFPTILQTIPESTGRTTTRLMVLYSFIDQRFDSDMDSFYYQWLDEVSESSKQIPKTLISRIARLISDFELISSEKGYIGIVPRGLVSAGNKLAVIAGTDFPFCVTTYPTASSRTRIRLQSPCVLDGHIPETRIELPPSYEQVMLAKRDVWVKSDTPGLQRRMGDGSSIMHGAVVVAEAVRRFDDPSRFEEVFEEMAII